MEKGSRPSVVVASTGNDSELVKTVPIRSGERSRPTVVMSLGNDAKQEFGRMPDLELGDRLLVLAEVEVTTDCADSNSACVGTPYTYSPSVTATLLLAGRPGSTLGDKDTVALPHGRLHKAALSQREHHGLFVFTRSELKVGPESISWSPEKTCLNVVLEATHSTAEGSDVLLVGENEPDGSVGDDKGRLSVVRFAGDAPDGQLARGELVTHSVPVLKGHPVVVLSCPLDNLEENDKLVVHASLRATAAHLGYVARLSARVILADAPGATTPGEAAKISSFGGEIAEHNGFNCLPGSRYARMFKVGVLRMTKAAKGEMYVNVVADSSAPFGGADADDQLPLLKGSLSIRRYRARAGKEQA